MPAELHDFDEDSVWVWYKPMKIWCTQFDVTIWCTFGTLTNMTVRPAHQDLARESS